LGKAASLFYGAGEQTLLKRVTPTTEQREFLQTQWNALADHLKQALYTDYGYPISTWLQGSYKYGTLIRPVHMDEEYDVDVGIYFQWENDGNATPAPTQLRDWVQRELLVFKSLNADVKNISEPPKERCSRAIYEKKFHIDTPVYHLEKSTDTRRLACLTGAWEDSDPKAIYEWFKNVAGGDDREQLRRLIRYLKGWAAVAFVESAAARPSSILLTVLAAESFEKHLLSRAVGLDDEDALITIIQDLHERLFGDRVVPNPIDDSEDLNRIPDEYWNVFLTNLQALRNAAENAEAEQDEAAAALAWSEFFSFLMPLPPAQEVEVVEEDSGRAIMVLPEIEIQVFDRATKKPIGKYRNEIPSVTKDCDLTFKIVNPHVIPEYASVEWTVRNDGEESDYIGDLGHRRMGIRMLEADEHTAYAGLHFMDCVVRLNGQIYAVRRVPVTVKDINYPARNPPRPAYTKLFSKFRRRR
jgi:hypothetical protein